MDRDRMHGLLVLLLKITIGLCVANFLVYLAGTMVLGGDALNQGTVTDGHFFIRSHGRTREVTQGLFAYSWWQAQTLKLTQPLFIAAFAAFFVLRVYAGR